MSWRARRRTATADDVLKGVVARATAAKGSAAAAEVAVRGALARAEVDRAIEHVTIVSVGNVPFARVLGAALGRDRKVTVVPYGEPRRDGDDDAAFLVLPAATPAAEAEAARDGLGPGLLGIVLADGPRRQGRGAEAPAGSGGELAGRLAELTHREAALRRVTDAVEQERARLEERERELADREQALERDPEADRLAAAQAEAVAERERALDDRARELEEREDALAAGAGERAAEAEAAAAALERAEAAERRVAEGDRRLAALQAELEEARRPPEPDPEPEPEPEPAAVPGGHNLRRLEALVHEAQLRNDPHAEEWAYYVPLLREHATLDGRLPAQFDTLVDSVFGSDT